MKAIHYLALYVSVFISGLSFSQNSLSGKISESAAGSPLDGAVIYIQDLRIAAQSAQDGSYSLNTIPQGTYLVEVHLLGYGIKSSIQGNAEG